MPHAVQMGTQLPQVPGTVPPTPPPHSLIWNIREGRSVSQPAQWEHDALRASRRPRWQHFSQVCKPAGFTGVPWPICPHVSPGSFQDHNSRGSVLTAALAAHCPGAPWVPSSAHLPYHFPRTDGARVPGPKGGASDTTGTQPLAGSMGLCSQGIQGCLGWRGPHLVCRCQNLMRRPSQLRGPEAALGAGPGRCLGGEGQSGVLEQEQALACGTGFEPTWHLRKVSSSLCALVFSSVKWE